MRKSSKKSSRKSSRKSTRKHAKKSSRKLNREPSKLTYKHENLQSSIKNNKSTTTEEKILDGPQGITFKFYSNIDEKKTKIVGGSSKDGKFYLNILEPNKELVKLEELTKKEVIKELEKYANAKFITDYLK